MHHDACRDEEFYRGFVCPLADKTCRRKPCGLKYILCFESFSSDPLICVVLTQQCGRAYGAVNLPQDKITRVSHLTATDDYLCVPVKTGGYGSVEAMGKMVADLEVWERETGDTQLLVDPARMTVMHGMTKANRL